MTKPTFAPVSSPSLARGCMLIGLLLAVGVTSAGCNNLRMGKGSPQGLDGTWTATLNPETVPIEVALALNSAEGGVLTGSVGAATIDDGKYSGEAEGSTIEFQTGAITVEGPTGEITREGPLTWTATLRGGTLEGVVTDSEGRTSQWTARRVASSSAPPVGRNSCEIPRRSVADAR